MFDADKLKLARNVPQHWPHHCTFVI